MGLFRKKSSKSAADDAAAPYQVLLIRPPWLDLGGAQSPSANIVHISRALLEIVDVGPSASYDLCAELNDRGVAVLGCWGKEQCEEIEARLRVKEISCRLVPAPQDVESDSAQSVDREEAVGAIPIREWTTKDKDMEKLEAMTKHEEEAESWRENGSVISSTDGEDRAKQAFLSSLEDDTDAVEEGEWGAEGAVKEREPKDKVKDKDEDEDEADADADANADDLEAAAPSSNSAGEGNDESASTPAANRPPVPASAGTAESAADSIKRMFEEGIITQLEYDAMIQADAQFAQTQVDLHNEAVSNEAALQKAAELKARRAKHKPTPLPPLLTADGRVPDLYDAYGNRHAEVQWVNSRIYNANNTTLDEMCLVEFCRKFLVPRKGPHAGRIKYHKGGYITKELQFQPQYSPDKDGPDYGKYCRFALVRYRPWVDSPFGKDEDGAERKPDLDECRVEWEAHVFHLQLRRSKIPDMLLPPEVRGRQFEKPKSPQKDEGGIGKVDAAAIASAIAGLEHSVDYAPMDVKSLAIEQDVTGNNPDEVPTSKDDKDASSGAASPKSDNKPANSNNSNVQTKAANQAAEKAEANVTSPEDARKRAMLLLGLADASSANISVKEGLAQVEELVAADRSSSAVVDLDDTVESEEKQGEESSDDLSNGASSADEEEDKEEEDKEDKEDKEEQENENVNTTDASPVGVEEISDIDNVEAAAPEVSSEKAKPDKKKKKRKTFKSSFKRSSSKGDSDARGAEDGEDDIEAKSAENVEDVVDAESDPASKDVEDRAGKIESMLNDLDDDTAEISKKPSADADEATPAAENEAKKEDSETDDDESIAYFEEEDDSNSIGSFSVEDIAGVPENTAKDDDGSAVTNNDNDDDADPKAEIDFDSMLDDGLVVGADPGEDSEYDPTKNQLNMFLEDADEDYYKQGDDDEPTAASSPQKGIKGKLGNALKRSGGGSPKRTMRMASTEGASAENASVPTVTVPKLPKPRKPSKLFNRAASKGSRGNKPSKKYEGLEDGDDVSILSERTSTAGSITRGDSGVLDMSEVDDESIATRDSDVPMLHDPFASPEANDTNKDKPPMEDLFANQAAASSFSEMRAADEAFAGGFPDASSDAVATDAFGFITSEKTQGTDEKANDTDKEAEEDPFVTFEPFASISDEEDAQNALDAFAQFTPARTASFEADGERSGISNVQSL